MGWRRYGGLKKEGWAGEGRMGWRKKGWVGEGRIGWRGKEGLETKGWVEVKL